MPENSKYARESGKPTEVFVRWESVVKKLENELTSNGDRPEVEE